MCPKDLDRHQFEHNHILADSGVAFSCVRTSLAKQLKFRTDKSVVCLVTASGHPLKISGQSTVFFKQKLGHLKNINDSSRGPQNFYDNWV